MLLKLCLSSCCTSVFTVDISLSMYMLPFFQFHSLPSLVVLTPLLPPVCISLCPFANSEVLFYHFKCFELPLGPPPPLALADLFWKPASPLQHPTSEAKETGRLWHVMVRSGRMCMCFGMGGGKDRTGLRQLKMINLSQTASLKAPEILKYAKEE